MNTRPPKLPQQTVIEAEPIPDFVNDFAGGDERLRKSMETVANDNRRLTQQNRDLLRARNNRAGALLLHMITVILGRLVLYVFVEDMGRSYEWAGLVADVVFGLAAVSALAKWLQAAWATTGMMMISNGVLVYVALELCCVLLLKHSHEITTICKVAAYTCGAMIIAASPLFVVVIDHTLMMLRNPIEYFTRDEKEDDDDAEK